MQLRRKSGEHGDRSYKVYSQMGWVCSRALTTAQLMERNGQRICGRVQQKMNNAVIDVGKGVMHAEGMEENSGMVVLPKYPRQSRKRLQS